VIPPSLDFASFIFGSDMFDLVAGVNEDDYENNLRIQDALGGNVKKAVRDINEAVPLIKSGSSEKCVICMSEPEGLIRKSKQCGHEFCAECIENWLSDHITCPVCVADLSVNGGYNLVDEPRREVRGRPSTVTDVSELMYRVDTIAAILQSLEQ
jgi:hypothetical protein